MAMHSGSFTTHVDSVGNVIMSLNRDGTISTVGINFPDGTTMTTAPVFDTSELERQINILEGIADLQRKQHEFLFKLVTELYRERIKPSLWERLKSALRRIYARLQSA